MTRILADLSDDDIKWLDARAAEQGKSRASVLREAVSAYRTGAPPSGNADWLEAGFGLWAKYGFSEDGMEYQNRMRNEWVREWDPEYDPSKHGSLTDEKDVAS
jgi:Ribbon-helix-helix protein, copG family